MPDMLFIMLLAVLLFGPKKLPEIARHIARFKNARDNLKSQLETEFGKLEAETRNIMPSGAEDLRNAFEPLTNLRQQFDNVITSSFEVEDKPKALPDAPPAAEKSAPPKDDMMAVSPVTFPTAPSEPMPRESAVDNHKSLDV
jgi:sec-independent protein translocase protein TatB